MIANAITITATLILIAGVIDDLRSRKVHNQLFLAATAIAFIVSAVTGGVAGVGGAITGFIAGMAILLPLVLLGVIGAGDMKLMAAFGAVVGWNAVINVAILSLIWGALFGLLQVILQGQLKATLGNMIAVLSSSKEQRAKLELHKIPFTVGLLLGWMTHLVWTRAFF